MRIILTPRSRLPGTEDTQTAPSPLRGRRSAIAPENLQAVLDSAPNAGAKGQAQWHTPAAWGEALALALPAYRPVVVDLTCGAGQLLAGCRAPGTNHLLGCDIEAFPQSGPAGDAFIHADLTLLAPLLSKSDWKADCFALNYPFDLHWYRDRLAFLAQSKCWAAELAFARHDGRTSKDTIDSTVAGLCLALDRCSPWGEGFIIANAATVERLIFAPEAPHAAVAAHIWARLTIPGNICDAQASPIAPSGQEFCSAVLYFARGHTGGVNRHVTLSPSPNLLAQAKLACADLGRCRTALRAGSSIRQYEGGHSTTTADLWQAIGLEWRTLQDCNRPGDQRWNIWLDPDGTIATNLTPFQESEPIKKQQYIRLNALKGKHPMQLILQKAERKELEKAVFGDIWRVAPAVIAAVGQALEDYNTQRSPLYPLNKIQRLGYLDDNDDILCTKDLVETSFPQLLAVFKAGQRYQIRTETLSVKRTGRKMNLTGELDDVQWEGSELALYIKSIGTDGKDDGQEHLFMEERLRKSDVRLSIQAENDPSPIEYNLQQLVEHFDIPEVPDVASKDPAGYQRNLDLLTLIEEIVNA